MNQFRKDLAAVLIEIKDLLESKNLKYGNSALEPLGVFSKLSAKEGLMVRIDDKLKRIKNGSLDHDDEDVVNDLIGYLILLKIHAKTESMPAYKKALAQEMEKWDFHDIKLDGI
jgi:hypothetical protein